MGKTMRADALNRGMPDLAARCLSALDAILSDPEGHGWKTIGGRKGLKSGGVAGAEKTVDGRVVFVWRGEDGTVEGLLSNNESSSSFVRGQVAKGDLKYIGSGVRIASISPDAAANESMLEKMFRRVRKMAETSGKDSDRAMMMELAAVIAEGGDPESVGAGLDAREGVPVFIHASGGEAQTLLLSELAAVSGGLDADVAQRAVEAQGRADLAAPGLVPDDVVQKLEFLMASMRDNSVTAEYEEGYGRSSKGLIFNDLDNGCAMLGDDLLIWSQNVEFLARRFSDGRWEVRAGGEYSFARDVRELQLQWDAGSPTDLVFAADKTGLLAVDNLWAECFSIDLRCSCSEAMGEYGGEIARPCDIGDFDYQLLYTVDRWGGVTKSRLGFTAHALGVLGGGYDPDGRGRLVYDEVGYDSRIHAMMDDGAAGEVPPGELSGTAVSRLYSNKVDGMLSSGMVLDAKWTAAAAELLAEIERVSAAGLPESESFGADAKGMASSLGRLVENSKKAMSRQPLKM